MPSQASKSARIPESRQHRPRVVPEALGFEEFVDRLGRGQREALHRNEFRDHLMVVGVEPFGHLERRQALPMRSVIGVPLSALLRMRNAKPAAKEFLFVRHVFTSISRRAVFGWFGLKLV